MVFNPKVVGVLSCGFLLCLGLSTVGSSADQLNTGKAVKGEIVKIDGEHYVVREGSGAEVRMQVDAHTEKRSLAPKVGDHVLAKVDAKGHAVSFLTDASLAH